MYVRLGFSVAINVDPDVLLVDEVLAVGDEEFQRRCNEKFAELRAQNKTIVVVSHGLGLMRTICDELAWLEHGKLRQVGAAGDVIDHYLAEVQTDRQPRATPRATAPGGARARPSSSDIEVLDADGPARPTGCTPVTRSRSGSATTPTQADRAAGVRSGHLQPRGRARHRAQHPRGRHGARLHRGRRAWST